MKLHNRKPNIENMYKVLRSEEPERPTLFELFLNLPLYERLAGRELPKTGDRDLEFRRLVIDAYTAAGYDYAWTYASSFTFPAKRSKEEDKNTISLNDGAVITGAASYEQYIWPDPENYDSSKLDAVKDYLPEGMKLMVVGPSGVLENVIQLTGYDNLCIMIYEEPELAKALFDDVGKRLLKYYEIAASYESVGLIMSNDDWGFKTQTFFSPAHMREYVFPWHKKIVAAAHAQKKMAILHSCGYFADVIEDIIEDIGFDGRHSYEDTIIPVEEAYEKWHSRIGIIGGMDVNFVIRHSEEEITARARAMLDRARGRGGYALGTGNSVPEYVPQEHYLAMIKAALEY
jgi:uroporphyrinogen decarboxylase